MTLMLVPAGPGETYVAASGNSFVSDANSIISVPLAADVVSLQAAGCIVLSPPPTNMLGVLKQANFNITSDQQVPLFFNANCRVTRIVAVNTSVNGMSGAAGGFYTGAGKTGSAIVAAGQVYTGLTNPTTTLELTIALPSLVILAGTLLYFSLTSGHGSAAMADLYVYGDTYV